VSARTPRTKVRAAGRVRDGALYIDDRQLFDQRLAEMPDGPVSLEVRLEGDRQSDAARGYYYAEVLPALVDHLHEQGVGEATIDSAHEALALRFLSLSPCPVTGSPRRRSISPDDMNDEEFKHYLFDQVLPFLIGEQGIDIQEPDPNKRSPRRRRELQGRDEQRSHGASTR